MSLPYSQEPLSPRSLPSPSSASRHPLYILRSSTYVPSVCRGNTSDRSFPSFSVTPGTFLYVVGPYTNTTKNNSTLFGFEQIDHYPPSVLSPLPVSGVSLSLPTTTSLTDKTTPTSLGPCTVVYNCRQSMVTSKESIVLFLIDDPYPDSVSSL